jgi:predicted phage baseplate assembly protein
VTLPVPNLDDRHFQALVDDAKRYVQQRCPEWSDHNVSDPGVTLIETFAMVVDQMIYRLNRVPDRLYLRFMELIGVQLLAPVAATVGVTFWLSAPRADSVTVPAGCEVATKRTETGESATFGTTDDLVIVPCSLAAVATIGADQGAQPVDHTDDLDRRESFPCFSAAPEPNDVLLFGLSTAVPRCAVALRLNCQVEGVGVDPRQPPLVWDAWTGRQWERCDLERDRTGGLNRPGDVLLHVPEGHTMSLIGQRSAGWLRCRLVRPGPDQPFYTASPRVQGVEAFTIGGTVEASYAETVRDELLGLSEGVPGQAFRLARRPVVVGSSLEVEVSTAAGWEQWTQIEHFGDSAAHDRHFVLDPVAGQIMFGPGVRDPNGVVRQYGEVPPRAAPLRVKSYRVGGGRRGNVVAGAITALRTSLPYVARIENRRAASGGVDGEDLQAAKVRAPLTLRTRNRAVTVSDFEHLARAADRRVARARCLASTELASPVVRLLVVPILFEPSHEPVSEATFRPAQSLLKTISDYLDERRILGTRLIVEPPEYQWITGVATVEATKGADPQQVRKDALTAMYRYLHPLRGGPEGTGWPFGRAVLAGELMAAVARSPGVAVVDEVRLYPAIRATGQRGEGWTLKVDLRPHTLPFSFEHHVEITNNDSR